MNKIDPSWITKLTVKAERLSWEPLATDGYIAAIAGKFSFVVKKDTTSVLDIDGNILDEYGTPTLLWRKAGARDARRLEGLDEVLKYLQSL